MPSLHTKKGHNYIEVNSEIIRVYGSYFDKAMMSPHIFYNSFVTVKLFFNTYFPFTFKKSNMLIL